MIALRNRVRGAGRRWAAAIVVAALLAASLPAPAPGQQESCALYRVGAGLLNIAREPRSDGIFKDVIEGGEIACVGRIERVGGRDWGFVEYKLRRADERQPVEGWAQLAQMSRLSPEEVAAFSGKGVGAAPVGPAPVAPAPARPAPESQRSSTTPPPPPPPEELLRFDQALEFGPFPVNGGTIKQLAEGVPLFAPFEGLEDAMWKRPCAACHRWDRAALCAQGATYARNPKNVLRHPHPYGGAYKIALMRWSRGGCQ